MTPQRAAPSSVSERAGAAPKPALGRGSLGEPRGELGQHWGAAGLSRLCEERPGLPRVGHGQFQQPL